MVSFAFVGRLRSFCRGGGEDSNAGVLATPGKKEKKKKEDTVNSPEFIIYCYDRPIPWSVGDEIYDRNRLPTHPTETLLSPITISSEIAPPFTALAFASIILSLVIIPSHNSNNVIGYSDDDARVCHNLYFSRYYYFSSLLSTVFVFII
jgi:hypothetical protein